jgi:hypothetical protein
MLVIKHIHYIISVNLFPFRLRLKLFTTAASISVVMLCAAVDLCLPFINLAGGIVSQQIDLCPAYVLYCAAPNH